MVRSKGKERKERKGHDDRGTSSTHSFRFFPTDLEWKVLYVGSAQDASRDQVLDEILVGPVPVGVNKFVLQADAPDPSHFDSTHDILGVTVVLVTCSYKEREFVRVGYYVNNEYNDPNAPPPPPQAVAAGTTGGTAAGADANTSMQEDDDNNNVEPPAPPLPNPIPLQHIQRQILADKPRVTKFPISWGDDDDEVEEQQRQQQRQQTQPQPLPPQEEFLAMQEESNASFGGSNNTIGGGGMQTMVE